MSWDDEDTLFNFVVNEAQHSKRLQELPSRSV